MELIIISYHKHTLVEEVNILLMVAGKICAKDCKQYKFALDTLILKHIQTSLEVKIYRPIKILGGRIPVYMHFKLYRFNPSEKTGPFMHDM